MLEPLTSSLVYPSKQNISYSRKPVTLKCPSYSYRFLETKLIISLKSRGCDVAGLTFHC